MKAQLSLLLVSFPLLSALAGAANAATMYSLTNLGSLYESAPSRPYGISASGEVTGYSTTQSGYTDAFLYSGGVIHDLGVLAGTTSSQGNSVNSSGQVTGTSFSMPSGPYDAFLYSGGVMTNLTSVVGTNSEGFGINNNGQITGSAAETGFIYSGGRVTVLNGTEAGYSINASGQVAGVAADNHAFLYSAGVVTDLGTLPGYNMSGGNSINASAQIVGYVQSSTSLEAFLYSGGVMTGIGSLPGFPESVANSINDSGYVVGYALNPPTGQYDAFFYKNGVMTDLNSLISPSSGWHLEEATGINDSGQITGIGMFGESQLPFLLSPTPEPSAWLLATLGAGGLWFARRRTRGTITRR